MTTGTHAILAYPVVGLVSALVAEYCFALGAIYLIVSLPRPVAVAALCLDRKAIFLPPLGVFAVGCLGFALTSFLSGDGNEDALLEGGHFSE